MFWFADRTGLEPATSAVTGQHSNQLNYRSVAFEWFVTRAIFQDGKDSPAIFFSQKFFFYLSTENQPIRRKTGIII